MFHKYHKNGIAQIFGFILLKDLLKSKLSTLMFWRIFKFGTFYEHVLEDNKIDLKYHINIILMEEKRSPCLN